jgi:hypothetical protein
MIFSLPAVCQVAFLSGFSLNVILVEGRITCASVSNDWRTCWETQTARPAHDSTLWGTSVWDAWSDCLLLHWWEDHQLRVCCPMLYWYSCLKSYFLQCSMCAWGIQSWLEKTWEHHCSKLVTVGGFKLLFLHLTWHHDRKLGFSSRLEPLKPRSRSPFWCLGEVNSNIFSLLSYQVQRPVDVFNLFLMPPKPRIQAY